MVTPDRPADWDPSPAAPGGLEPVRRFVNTLDCYRRRDGLTDLPTARRSLRHAGIPGAAQIARRLDPASLTAFRQARAAMRAVLGCTTWWDPRAAPGIGGECREQVPEWPVVVRVDLGPGGVHLAHTQHAAESALSVMALDLLIARQTGTINRLKVCANPGCQWVFWDSSRPSSARWCSMRVCGGQAKSRRHRERHAVRR